MEEVDYSKLSDEELLKLHDYYKTDSVIKDNTQMALKILLNSFK